MKKSIITGVMLLMGVFVSSVSAEVRPMVMGGIYAGGDDLVETTTEDLQAGGFLYIGAGILIEPENSNMVFQATLGYKWDTIEFDIPSGDSTISSNPLEITAYIRADNVRLGGGIAYHMSPEWEFCLDGSGCAKADFDDALGFILEGVWDASRNVAVGLRFTSIDYETNGLTIDANNIGVNVGFIF